MEQIDMTFISIHLYEALEIMNDDVLLSIITVAYKCYPLLRDCIDSVYKHNDIDSRLEIIVVDNSPDLAEIEKLKEIYPYVQFILSENKGFGAGNNRGAEQACGKYLLFLNPDTIIIEPIFRQIISTFEKNDKIGTIGFKLTKDNHAVISVNYKLRFGVIKHILSHISNRFEFFVSGKMYTSGADLCVRRDIFMKVGCFDENLFMYGEEFDITERINNAGYKSKYMPQYTIMHLEGGTSPNIEADKFEKILQSYIYVLEKYSYDVVKECNREIRFLELKKRLTHDSSIEYYEKILEKHVLIAKTKRRRK